MIIYKGHDFLWVNVRKHQTYWSVYTKVITEFCHRYSITPFPLQVQCTQHLLTSGLQQLSSCLSKKWTGQSWDFENIYLSRMKREEERPRVMTMLTNHRSVPGNKMSYSCLSRLQCMMHARATSRTFAVTYSVHVHCTQNGCDITIFMASCRVTVTLSGLVVFGNNTLNGIFATIRNKEVSKV
jgi:hypothetical protein